MAHSGQFKPGQSGNPSGKKPGTRNRYTLYRKQLEPHMPEILDMLIGKAKDGDLAAAKLLLERVYPATAEKDIRMEEQLEAMQAQLDKLERTR